jgi:CSLREA domain-containing protein
MRRLAVAALVATALTLPAAASADLTVNTTVDSDDGVCNAPPAGDCSLREALDVTQAGEVITVPAGTYTVALQYVVDHNVTIRGAGARTTTLRFFAPDSTGRVISVLSDVTLNLSRVRVTGGNSPTEAGGGIFVSFGATLNLTDSSVDGNTGDGGGGIQADGAIHLVRTAVVRNHAVGAESQALGGGINVGEGGSATLENVTVSNNTAIDVDDGQGLGGGIFANAGLDLVNVTIADNRAADGGPSVGGGLYQNFAGGPPRTVARNSLVARNAGGNCGGSVNDPIEITNWLSDDATCPTVGSGTQVVASAGLGTLANNGGASDTSALLAGSPAINKGASCPATDQRGVAREGACDLGAYEYHAPPPPPPADQGLPDPVPHKNVNALPKSGTVKIKLPGSGKFVELVEGQQIPLGTIVDTRKGRVTIVAAAGDGQTADFYAGLFKLSQTKGKKPITVLTLVEKLTGCKAKGKATAAAKKKRKRRLWGDGKGRFRTKGKHSAATVVGTKWLVEDKCTSTLTHVVRGKVRVRDFVKKKTVLVKAGKKYVARAR